MSPRSGRQGELFGAADAAWQRREQQQREAVAAPDDEHLRILAGPGAGKTHVLVERSARLIAAGLPAGALAAITYTNSARDELLARLRQRLGPEAPLPFAGTIHQFCLRLAQRAAGSLGLPARLRVLDPEAAGRLFASRAEPPRGEAPRRLFERLCLEWERYAGQGPPPAPPPEQSRAWQRFDRLLRRQGLATFVGLQLWALEALEAGAVRGPAQLLVDEYQDTSGLQVRVLAALAAAGSRIAVVGDPEQSVFAFAGADARHLPDFCDRFQPCRTVRIAVNGRSSGAIVRLAGRLRRDGPQLPLRAEGRRPRLIHLDSEGHQARWLAERIARLLRQEGLAPGDVAVLAREGRSTAVAEALFERDLPLFQPRSERFEAKPHVRGLVLALEALAAPEDEQTWYFFFDGVLRGAPKTWDAVIAARRETDSLAAALEVARQRVARPRQAALDKLSESRRCLEALRGLEPVERAAALAAELLEPRLGLRERRRLDAIRADWQRVARAAALHPDPAELAAWLRQGGLAPAAGGDRITLASLHYAKGREWPVVFLIDLTRGVIPHRGNADADEERRLLHVGLSRAGERLYLCAPARLPGRGEGPSPLLAELAELCRVSDLRGQG